MSALKILAIISMIGLIVFWFLTFLLVPIPTSEAVMLWLTPVYLWIFATSFFSITLVVLSFILIIRLISKIEALEKFSKRQTIPAPPEFKTE